MGNGQVRYMNNGDAITLLGSKCWLEIHERLERPGIKYVDFEFFDQLLRSRFDKIPSSLVRLLFKGFAADIGTKIDIDVFIATLAVFYSPSKELQLKFLSRVYDSGTNTIDRVKLEDILSLVSEDINGEYKTDFRTEIDSLFMRAHKEISHREFELYKGDIGWLSRWVQHVLKIWIEHPPMLPSPHHLLAFSRNPNDAVVVTPKLKARFEELCEEGSRGWMLSVEVGRTIVVGDVPLVLSLSTWLSIVSPLFLSLPLALVLFGGRLSRLRAVWSEMDFVSFALDFGGWVATADERKHEGREDSRMCKLVSALLTAFLDYNERLRDYETDKPFVAIACQFFHDSEALRFVTLLSLPYDFVAQEGFDSKTDIDSPLPPLPSLPPLPLDLAKRWKAYWDEHAIGTSSHISLVELSNFVVREAGCLPGLRDLQLTAWALGGLQPPSSILEKESIVELTLRYIALAASERLSNPVLATNDPNTSAGHKSTCDDSTESAGMFPSPFETPHPGLTQSLRPLPYGPMHTPWSLLPRLFHDTWCRSVGSSRTSGGQTSNLHYTPVPVLDLSCLYDGTTGEMLGGLEVGRDVEVVPPPVFFALKGWYGAVLDGEGAGKTRLCGLLRRVNSVGDVELYPLFISLWNCDDRGRPSIFWTTRMLSPLDCIQQLIAQISREKHLSCDEVRLWLLSPSAGASDAGTEREPRLLLPNESWKKYEVVSFARVLVEIRRSGGGTWPRGECFVRGAHPLASGDSGGNFKGLVGFDNMGNTCYLNACLQVLFHSPPLREYLLSDLYAKHINRGGPASGSASPGAGGSEGRLADSLGKLAQQYMSASNFSSLSPKVFYREVLRWRGNLFSSRDQHDAQELLAFLLEGLSEDLNLNGFVVGNQQSDCVLETTTSSSDQALNSKLTDVLTETAPLVTADPRITETDESRKAHRSLLARERSIVAALCTGQYRCTLQCSCCDYKSSQYEPFNNLPVPLPDTVNEDQDRHLICCIARREFSKSCRLTLKGSSFYNVSSLIASAGSTIGCEALSWCDTSQYDNTSSESLLFVAAELHPVTLKVKCFLSPEKKFGGLTTYSGGALLCLFEVGRSHAQESVVLPNAELLQKPEACPAKVIFTMRRARIAIGKSCGLRGYDTLLPEQFLLPFVELVSPGLSCSRLYDLVEYRVAPLFKLPLDLLLRYSAKLTALPCQGITLSDLTCISSLSSDDVFCGRIPKRGFTLRFVSSKTGLSGGVCSRCPWLSRCSGCALPDSHIPLFLSDGEGISVDFHHLVTEELFSYILPSLPPSFVPISLPTPEAEHVSKTTLSIPISACLTKFVESELLPDFNCPECKKKGLQKNDSGQFGLVSRSLTLSYLPPILILHLKRFQWIPTSNKGDSLGVGRWIKLSPRVDFPLTSFNLSPFMHSAQKYEILESVEASDNSDLSLYDLYAVIHHIGALGGGHYIASIKVTEGVTNRSSAFPNGPSVPLESPSNSHIKHTGRWFTFNDNVVSAIPEPPDVDVTASSAYLLFYIRRDFASFSEGDSLTNLLNSLGINGESNGDFCLDKPPAATNAHVASHSMIESDEKSRLRKEVLKDNCYIQ